ncbi:hypothetical protein JXQ70_03320 [bacterium]|nr:hypothetical protein [bacterium]
MKKSFMVFVILSVFGGWTMSGNVEAAGIGLYLNNGSGDATWKNDDSGAEVDVDTDISGFGMIIESNVSKDKVYSNRLTFGPEVNELSASGGSVELQGYALHSDFGFGGNIADVVRLYGGFQIRAVWYVEAEGDHYNEDASITGFGVGPLIGVNVNPVPVVTFALKAGFTYSSYYGDVEEVDYKLEDHQYTYFNLGLIFRFSEDY